MNSIQKFINMPFSLLEKILLFDEVNTQCNSFFYKLYKVEPAPNIKYPGTKIYFYEQRTDFSKQCCFCSEYSQKFQETRFHILQLSHKNGNKDLFRFCNQTKFCWKEARLACRFIANWLLFSHIINDFSPDIKIYLFRIIWTYK